MSEENGQEEVELFYEGVATGEDGEITVEAIDTKSQRKAVMYKNFGATLADAVAAVGEEVVHSNYRAQGKIRLQALMRSRLKESTSLDDLATWMPGVAMERVSKTTPESAENMFEKMSTLGTLMTPKFYCKMLDT